MSTPAVSVVMSAYNAERYLREAMDSMLAQTFRDFELILIDDGSKDATAKIANEYAAKDDRVRVVSRPNKGLTVSLNEGFSLASAPYFARMDADDVALPQRFERQVAFLNANPTLWLSAAMSNSSIPTASTSATSNTQPTTPRSTSA